MPPEIKTHSDRPRPVCLPAYVLAYFDRLCSIYACAGFNLFTEFQHEMRTDLRNALRKARRAFDDGHWRRQNCSAVF
jgi:hypothetical protein